MSKYYITDDNETERIEISKELAEFIIKNAPLGMDIIEITRTHHTTIESPNINQD